MAGNEPVGLLPGASGSGLVPTSAATAFAGAAAGAGAGAGAIAGTMSMGHSPEATAASAAAAGIRNAAGTGGADAVRLDAGFNVLASVEEQVRFADQKAAFLATLHSFLISALGGNALYMRSMISSWDTGSVWLLGVSFGIYALMFLVAMAFVALTVLPRMRKTGRPPSKAFFGRIAAKYADDPDAYLAELASMREGEWTAEVGRYIVDASAIAVTKHRFVRRATQLTVPTVLVWLITVLILMFAGPAAKPPTAAPHDAPPPVVPSHPPVGR